jgi:hypothetical protein
MLMRFNNIIAALAVSTLTAAPLSAEVRTWEPPACVQEGNRLISRSDQYRVEVLQDGKTVECFVYLMHAMQYTNKSLTTSWASFDFDGKVTVRVTRLTDTVSYCAVLPTSKGIVPRKSVRSVEFEIDRPGQFSVDFQRGLFIDHPLLIFADPHDSDVPSPDDPSVIFFGPGLHEIGESYRVPSNTTVYLAGGAYIKGRFFSENGENIEFRGRGIISGEDYAAREIGPLIAISNCKNMLVEGITIIHAPSWCVRFSGINHTVRNVKMIGWWFSTDGVQTGTNGLIEDCFFKVNDDAIKLYTDNNIARRCVIWQMENGAPFQIGWGGSDDVSNFTAYDCDIIRVEHEWDNENEAIFCSIHGGEAHKRQYLFEDIRIENSQWRVFHIITKPNRWADWNPDKGNLSDITFRNIDFKGVQKVPSLIKGWDANHKIWNVTFENVRFNGKVIEAMDPEILYVDPETTRNVRFDNY